jgi:hypothetical protein|uniref:Uncharacterized protein n=1 Tax=Eutreptiella gymnastica TaxID=73025 RepID=A0A7S4FDT7_9EUGL|mmetsp:Transcript_12725/g.23133  ORF Transcript_12725/g.23133 Transcript_12725/m.23133 type:complete len:134 (+) Transcript_12725:133-534(+)|eukprot:CAMPEP_0174282216 /NCGR_PEP_ID=MMETSP0809-20121228/2689_1 /TAXON_ID=73025 ORGANISM="Eutreptiella gymnastica-like, Strain CCMP1594" /NCGR_SAMPLE_ID=MMETSP0809 /ASSEMBLY_ACC=CAM_ASM_000658 /LENGTH=133 /DNA_ID=CAMNT_0015376265 /DNA_START=132 /DNA_END=533 /DNA_ORIENTATION=+
MPQHHHYRNDGTGRDLYVNRGVVNPIQGNVEARFDTLPSNVRGYLKEQVGRENYQAYTSTVDATRNRNLPWEDCKGKMVPRKAMQEIHQEGQYGMLEAKELRRTRLRELYQGELEQWNRELNALGYAIEKDRD